MIRNILITLAIASTAVAQEFNPYFSVGGGASFLEVSGRAGGEKFSEHADPGYVVEGAVGLAYKDDVDASALRVELALSFQENEGIEIGAAMANGYFDLSTGTVFTPYLLAGVGRASVDDGAFYTFAYQFGGGIGYSISENMVLDLKYKYFATEDYELMGVNYRTASQQVQLGIRYQF